MIDFLKDRESDQGGLSAKQKHTGALQRYRISSEWRTQFVTARNRASSSGAGTSRAGPSADTNNVRVTPENGNGMIFTFAVIPYGLSPNADKVALTDHYRASCGGVHLQISQNHCEENGKSIPGGELFFVPLYACV